MYYEYELEYYEERELYVISGVVRANSYAEALDKIDSTYDASTLTNIKIEKSQDTECFELGCRRKENR